MGLAELAVAIDLLRGVKDDEQGIAVELDLRPLVRVLCVFDRKGVEVEFLLHLLEQRLVGLMHPDPNEGLRLVSASR